jgi:hypothetical protein
MSIYLNLEKNTTLNTIYVNGFPVVKTLPHSQCPALHHYNIYTSRHMYQHWQIIDCTSQLIFLPLLGL